MGALAGKDGSISVGAAAVGYIDNWNLTINSGTQEANQLGQDWKEFLATVKDWSGSMSGSLDTSDIQQKAMITSMTSGDVADVALELAVDTTNKFSGNALLTSIQIGVEFAGKVSFSANFQGTGALAEALPVA